ncbi:methionyl-tRNA formyltransferase [Endothiovibrio diazotrophicus]
MTEPLKIVFAGTPEFAVSTLQALLASHHQVVAVYTQPDRPAGRGRKLRPSPVKALALEHDLPVEQPVNFKEAGTVTRLAAYGADLMVVVAYGLLLPRAVLETPRLGCVNVHASLLPRWRGAAPIHRAVLAGDAESGVTIMQMDVGLDTGDMLLKGTTPIGPRDTTATLHDRLATMGGKLLVEAAGLLAAGAARPEPQDDALANYAHKLSKEEGRIDWSRPAAELDRQVRAFDPFPVAYTRWRDDNLRIWTAEALPGSGEAGRVVAAGKAGIDVATGSGLLRITRLQPPGKKAMGASDFLNAHDLTDAHFD